MRWITASFLFVFVMAFCFIIFIVFNFVLYNPDNGIHTILDNFAQGQFTRSYLDFWDSTTTNIYYGFGLAGVVCMFCAIICYVADVFSRPNLEGYG